MHQTGLLRLLPLPVHPDLPAEARVYLREKPGRTGDIQAELAEIDRQGVAHVLCLLTENELNMAHSYRDALKGGHLSAKFHHCPLDTSCRIEDRPRLMSFLHRMAAALHNGESVLIHCEMGQVRTGCAATLLLTLFGVDRDEALATVRMAGSDPEVFDPVPMMRSEVVPQNGASGL
jgi:protein tyrosine/serine phosphatase